MWQKNCYRIVVKVGTSTLTHDTGAANLHNIEKLVKVLADLQGYGHEVILVSSGAIAVGASKLMLKERPKELRMKQAAAAVGQCQLMHLYDKFFAEYNQTVAQILLTDGDVNDDTCRAHLQQTFEALLETGVIPVVNENDSVSTAEIETGDRKVLGDNDTLSAIVAKLTNADLLVLFSDIDGVFDKDPHKNSDAKLISRIEKIDENIEKLAGGAGTERGTGGMVTKISAAKIAVSSGCDMVIANGQNPEYLYDIVNGKDIGTRFVGEKND